MKPFRIKKQELIEKVEFNRREHRAIYERADEGWKAQFQKWLDKQRDAVFEGEEFETFFNEPRPQDHTEDYDVVLDGWKMSEDEEIELSIQEFRQYVRDEWGWKKDFMATSQSYIAS